jgi:hypothetical protein
LEVEKMTAPARIDRSETVTRLVSELRAEADTIRSSSSNLQVQKQKLQAVLKQLNQARDVFIGMGNAGTYGANLAAAAATEVSAHLAIVSSAIRKEIAAARQLLESDTSPVPREVPLVRSADEVSANNGCRSSLLAVLYAWLVFLSVGFVMLIYSLVVNAPEIAIIVAAIGGYYGILRLGNESKRRRLEEE